MIYKTCLNCGKEFGVINSRKNTAKFCSKKCGGEYHSGKNYTICTECGNSYHLKESSKKRYKRTQGYFCSTKCVADFRKKQYIGENNPNFRNIQRKEGYLLGYLPRFGKIKLHHKVVFEFLNISKIPDNYCVHHRDCEIDNNDIENLVLLSGSDHRWLHKNFGNATLWAYMNNKISLDELCDWCKSPAKARKLLPLSIANQIEIIYTSAELSDTERGVKGFGSTGI